MVLLVVLNIYLEKWKYLFLKQGFFPFHFMNICLGTESWYIFFSIKLKEGFIFDPAFI